MRMISLMKVGTALVISLVFGMKVNLVKIYAVLDALSTMTPVCQMRVLLMQKVSKDAGIVFVKNIRQHHSKKSTTRVRFRFLSRGVIH